MTWTMASYALVDAGVIIMLSLVISLPLTVGVVAGYRTFFEDIQLLPIGRVFVEVFMIALPFAVVGVVAGFLTGASRSSAVSATVPAVLTLFGAMVAYLMTMGLRTSMLAGISVTAFSCALLVGSIAGSLERQEVDASENSIAQGFREAEKELAIRNYRRNLGLPPQMERTRAPAAEPAGAGVGSEKK